jgi:hypothetical protein
MQTEHTTQESPFKAVKQGYAVIEPRRIIPQEGFVPHG